MSHCLSRNSSFRVRQPLAWASFKRFHFYCQDLTSQAHDHARVCLRSFILACTATIKMSHIVRRGATPVTFAGASTSASRQATAPPTSAQRQGRCGKLYGASQLHACVQWQEMRSRSMVGCHVDASSAAATSGTVAKTADASLVTALDIRVGRIIKVEQHPDADTLYIEQIEVGEPEPRTIVSGLVKYVPIEQMQDRDVLVLCNLKPRNMRGIKSNGMVLCASNADHTAVEPLAPPTGSTAGQRVWFGEGNEKQPPAAEPNRIQKKKIWEEVQPLLRTRDDGVAACQGKAMLTAAGPVTAASLKGASIS